ncbi:MAG: Hpt domain-containing protein, partial [Shewanella sp.]
STDKTSSERAAHTLKGVAGSIGAIRVQRAAGELETACEQQLDKSIIKLRLLKVSSELEVVMDGLTTFFALNKNKAINNQQEVILDINKIQHLRILIAENDAEAVDLITDLVAEQYANVYGEILANVELSMAEYDFDSALNFVDDLLTAIKGESLAGVIE